MRIPHFLAIAALSLAAGCAGKSATKPVEVLDEHTGMTVGSLKEPIELTPSAQGAAANYGKRTTFAYLGPLEWDRMGTIGYGLWVHVAPGGDPQPVNIRAPGAVTLFLDDGPIGLSPIDVPPLGFEPYRPVVSWGQTGYFDLSVEVLRKMAASEKLELDVRASNDSTMSFFPTRDSRPALQQYLRDRGITAD